MIKKEQILEILNTNTEWLSDNDVILKSDFNKVADAIVKLCNLHVDINWVAVAEKLPPRPDEDYLVVMRNKNKEGGIALQDVKNFTSDGTWVGGNNWEDVVAWAELPQPPCL